MSYKTVFEKDPSYVSWCRKHLTKDSAKGPALDWSRYIKAQDLVDCKAANVPFYAGTTFRRELEMQNFGFFHSFVPVLMSSAAESCRSRAESNSKSFFCSKKTLAPDHSPPFYKGRRGCSGVWADWLANETKPATRTRHSTSIRENSQTFLDDRCFIKHFMTLNEHNRHCGCTRLVF
jgi:hypothetical protein